MRILDMGSGNTCRNDINIIKKMIDSIAEVDPERKLVLKWQLFKEAPPNYPLAKSNFNWAYNYALDLGYQTTASVFDVGSLHFLLIHNPSFVKIANRPDLYWLIGEVPRKIEIVLSYKSSHALDKYDDIENEEINYLLCCISKYPAKLGSYEKKFNKSCLKRGISDHTTDWQLFRKYKPEFYECHFKLLDSTGPDSGEFARTPEQISEIYEEL